MKKRDSAYYRKRLAKDHPLIYAEVVAGRLSVRAASAKADLIHLPTRVDALKREWKRASEAQRDEFQEWVKTGTSKGRPKPIADADGRLRTDVRAFLSHWITSHKSRPGRILEEIGFSVHDYTLSWAISDGHGLRPDVIPKLSAWLIARGLR
ncbi:MAG: hypothetical protein ABSA68_12155 [Xanthobacteraceae bacterium]|jgi:hypothetical protein